MNGFSKNTKGITLVSLVITIVVLIILAGVVVYLSIGNNGIFIRAKQANELTNKQEATEIISLKITTAQMNKYAETQEILTLKELSEVLRDDNEIQYVTESTKIGSTKYEVGEDPKVLYIKLKKYKYEFQINENLEIEKINGEKISSNNNNNSNNVIGSIGESELIEDIELIVSFNNGEYLELTCNSKTKNNDDIALYVFLLNDEVKAFNKENIENIGDLTLDTNYTVAAIAMDKYGKIKRTNNIQVKTENKVYLYKEGNECGYLTGGWKKTGYAWHDYGTITKNESNMYIYAPNESRIYCSTSKILDFTKYTGLYIESEANQNLYDISTTNYYNNQNPIKQMSYKSAEKIDISNYNSKYYFHLTNANTGYSTIKNIWLEY